MKIIPAAMTEVVSANPITTLVSFISAASVIIGAVFFVDDRYAHAGDVDVLKEQQGQMIQYQKEAVTALRKETLEDKLFELSLKDKPTSTDRALIDRYTNQLHDLQTQEVQHAK